ncbi:MAG: leucyl aminopeptidase [Burkholderiaceae bacterium]|nr:leucyl aminopeptidase [Burkholderiaceae bacterium]
MTSPLQFDLRSMSLGDCVSAKCDALVLLISEQFKPGKDEVSQFIDMAIKAGDLELKAGKSLQLYRHSLFEATKVILVGAGSANARQVRQAVLSAVGIVRAGTAKKMVISHALLDGAAANSLGALVKAVVAAAAEASYVYTSTKSKADPRKLRAVTLGVPDVSAVQADFAHAKALVAGVELAKEWANRPANHATPTMLAEAAQAIAKRSGFSCDVLGPKQVAALRMGAFMAVARGSAEPLRFIVLKYLGGATADEPVVLVGKGITFDTGGISLKPGAEMDEMKFDMCGAASVLGVFASLAQTKPKINVIGLIAACENMPDGTALKPGDVVTSMSGQTIEVLNTDAEGRLILCDALTFAERFKPKAVVDVATLTGACVVALGGVRSGLFASDDKLAAALEAAGESAQDPCWRLPLDEDYAEGLKSNFADVANVGGRAGGAVTAAKFLQRFASKFPWAHLDIAGTAWKSGAAKGATGRPVGLLLDYLVSQSSMQTPTPKQPRASKPVGARANLAPSA